MLTPRRGTDRKLVRQLLTLDGGPVRPQPFVSGLLPSCGTSLRHCSSGRSEPPGFADCIILLQPLHHPAHLDRNSVVSGKSVSVRVDLGVSRIMKKKTQKYN